MARWIAGVFDSEEKLLAAARSARKAGLFPYDAYTPFPVHGMDEALQIPPTRLPKVCFAFGAAGLTLALSFQYYVSLFDWPMNIGGKSYDASPALIPVAFELTVLFAGLGTVAAFLKRSRLYPGQTPAWAGLKAVDDRFLLVFREGPEDAAAHDGVRAFLRREGALAVREAEGRP